MAATTASQPPSLPSPIQGQTIQDLALQISSLAYQCSTLLNASTASQDATATADLTTTSDTPAASAARASLPADLRNQLAEAALDLWSVILGPEERVRRLTIEWSIPAALRYIVHFGIADLVPAQGDISYEELAAAAKVPEAHLKRIMRLAATAGIFSEQVPGRVAHTMLSIRFSKAYPELASYSAHVLEFTFPVVARMPEMSERWQGSDAKTHTAFNVAHNTEEALFPWLQHEPEHAKRFVGLMDAMRRNPTWDVKHLVEGWEGWTELPAGSKIVDVGGSVGHTSIALADKYQELEFVVQDLPYVIAGAKASKSVPEALQDRVQLATHDFFTEQPVQDADIYLLRQIMHDWADESAVRILQGIVPALQKKGSRILIMDQVVPPPGTLGRSQEREARTADLVVMSHFNGKQRDLDEWKSLLQTADARLKISKVLQPVGSHFAIIEIDLQPEPAAPLTDVVQVEVAPVAPDEIPILNGNHEASINEAVVAQIDVPSVQDHEEPPSANGSAIASTVKEDTVIPQHDDTTVDISQQESAVEPEHLVKKATHRKTDSVTSISETDGVAQPKSEEPQISSNVSVTA